MKEIRERLIKKYPHILKRKKIRFNAVIVDEHPEKEMIPENLLLIVEEEKKYKKWVYLRCPCGCKELILLSLSKKSYPHWKIKLNRQNIPTIFPSIRRTSGCRSHFWIYQGIVYWCKYYFDGYSNYYKKVI